MEYLGFSVLELRKSDEPDYQEFIESQLLGKALFEQDHFDPLIHKEALWDRLLSETLFILIG